jgi:hypothetical protein
MIRYMVETRIGKSESACIEYREQPLLPYSALHCSTDFGGTSSETSSPFHLKHEIVITRVHDGSSIYIAKWSATLDGNKG